VRYRVSYIELDYRDYVKISEDFYRVSEETPLVGNPEKKRPGKFSDENRKKISKGLSKKWL